MKTQAACGLILVLATLLAYGPAYRAGYVWDDESYVVNNETLRSPDGLRRIWFEIGATDQYYPLVFTTFWLEYQLWGLHPAGYHIVNVLLHAASALMLWLMLRRLGVKWAMLAGLLFALHPVNVESVAWVTERKNTLSLLFYLGAMWYCLRYAGLLSDADDPCRIHKNAQANPLKAANTGASQAQDKLPHSPPARRAYALGLGLFLCALASKSVTASLPAAVLLIVWWKRGRIRRSDVLPLIPFFVLGLASGLLTAYVEKHHVGTKYVDWDLSLLDRSLIAGRAICFYIQKLVWPANLAFSYPRWEIDATDWRAYAFPLVVLLTVGGLWLSRRRMGRGPLAASLFFIGTLFPALGFVDVYPMRFSFVADHFQYHACIGIFALIAGVLGSMAGAKSLRLGVSFAALIGLSVLTWRQCGIYRDGETIWTDTIRKNPESWMAHGNLAAIRVKQGHFEAGIELYERGMALKPDAPHVEFQLAAVLAAVGRVDEAILRYESVIVHEPGHHQARTNLANLLLQTGRPSEAEPHHRRVVELLPGDALAHHNLGMTLARLGRKEEAVQKFRDAIRLEPDLAASHAQLGILMTSMAKIDSAIHHLRQAVLLEPGAFMPRFNLASILLARGETQEAVVHLEAAAQIDPGSAMVRDRLNAARQALQNGK